MDWITEEMGVWFSAGERDFCLLRSVQTVHGIHPAPSSVGTGGCCPRVKAGGVWSWPYSSS